MRKLAYALLAGFLFASSAAVSQVVFGLIAGPVGVGFPVLRTVAGSATFPAQLGPFDNQSGIFYPAAGLVSTSAGGVESERLGATFNARALTITTQASATSATLTAAQLVGGLINRTTVGAAQTDTTDTASAIDTALGSPPVGMGFQYSYSNATANAVTAAGGTNVTFQGTATYPASADKLVTCVKTAATPTYTCQ